MTSSQNHSLGSFDPPDENALYPELFALHREIHAFSKDINDISRLLEIQKRLIRAISEAERKIREIKLTEADPRDWQYVRYNFLCLGDCLAFLFADRFALKQHFFHVDSEGEKQGGGFISDKRGHENEMHLLEAALSRDVPAVLCDITNVLRYGDICLFGYADPVPIEVKSSKTKDSRGKRQMRELKKLSDFLATDKAEGFRGRQYTTIRTEYHSPPKSYSEQLVTSFGEALKHGTASFEVDECLKILVIATDDADYDELFGGFGSGRVLVNSVNQIKTNKFWGCYYPYPLTFSEPKHFELFVRGVIHIFTLLDMNAFESELAEHGAELSVEADEFAIECQILFPNWIQGDSIGFSKIGDHTMCRMWTDFLCPSWIVKNAIHFFENHAAEILKEGPIDEQF